MILSFHPCFETDNQVILGDSELDEAGLELVGSSEAIILPQSCPPFLYEACTKTNAFIFPSYDIRFRYQGKTGQHRLFEDFGFPQPDTLCWKTVKEYKEAYPDPGRLPHKTPFFVKADRSHEAEGLYLVSDGFSLSEALEGLTLKERSGLTGFVTQELILSDGNILRVVIIGSKLITYWKRLGRPGQFISTIRQGAMIDYEWRPELREKGKRWVRALAEATGINLAAFDLVFSSLEHDPEPLFLEINYYFGRRGLGGSLNYYHLLYGALREWLVRVGMDPESVRLV